MTYKSKKWLVICDSSLSVRMSHASCFDIQTWDSIPLLPSTTTELP